MSIDITKSKVKEPSIEVLIPKKPMKRESAEASSPPEITTQIKLVEEEEEIEDKEFETPSERMEMGRFTNLSVNSGVKKSPGSYMNMQSDFKQSKTTLQSFNPIAEAPPKEEDYPAMGDINQPYHLDVRASLGNTAEKQLVLNTHKMTNSVQRKVRFKLVTICV